MLDKQNKNEIQLAEKHAQLVLEKKHVLESKQELQNQVQLLTNEKELIIQEKMDAVRLQILLSDEKIDLQKNLFIYQQYDFIIYPDLKLIPEMENILINSYRLQVSCQFLF